MSNFSQGDIVYVPFPDGKRAAIVKIVYISTLFKNVIGIAVCQWAVGRTLRNMELQQVRSPALYTNILASGVSAWEVLGNRGLTEEEEKITTRIVGDEVFCEDEVIRKVSQSDTKHLPRMLVAGMPIIYEWITKILDGKPIIFGSGIE